MPQFDPVSAPLRRPATPAHLFVPLPSSGAGGAGSITRLMAAYWDVANTVEQSFSPAWSLVQAVSQDRAIVWDTGELAFVPVEQDYSASWSSVSSRTQSFFAGWNVIAAVSQDRAVTWNVTSEVGPAELAPSWNMVAALTQDRAVTWNTIAAVSSDYLDAWDVEGSAVQLWATNFETGITLSGQGTGTGNTDQYIRGSDDANFPTDPPLTLWGGQDFWSWWVLSVVGSGAPQPTVDYIENTMKTVTARDGVSTRVLSLHSKADSPMTDVQQISFQNYGMTQEPVIYQRSWIKFDEDMLTRAQTEGEGVFYQLCWECKANPDYRLRVQILYSATQGLYWHTQGDVLTNANALWEATLFYPPVLAPQSSPMGWHRFELWMDRFAPRFKVMIDGQLLIDRTSPMRGATETNVDELKWHNVYGIAVLGELLVDHLQIWDSPPADAWDDGITLSANQAPALSTMETTGVVASEVATLDAGEYIFTSNFATSGVAEIKYEGTGNVLYRENAADSFASGALPITLRKHSDTIERVQVVADGGTATVTAITVRNVTFD